MSKRILFEARALVEQAALDENEIPHEDGVLQGNLVQLDEDNTWIASPDVYIDEDVVGYDWWVAVDSETVEILTDEK